MAAITKAAILGLASPSGDSNAGSIEPLVFPEVREVSQVTRLARQDKTVPLSSPGEFGLPWPKASVPLSFCQLRFKTRVSLALTGSMRFWDVSERQVVR